VKISKEVKVALLGVVAIVALVLGYTFLRGSNIFSKSRPFYAVYDSVDGLTVSNPVLLNGVKVGIVQDVQLEPSLKNKIVVTMDIDKKVDIGDSTIANLSSSSILGGKAINLEMGLNTKRFEGGDTLIANVETSITDMLSAKAMPLAGRIDSTLIRINAILNEESKKSIQATLKNTQAASEILKNILTMNQQNITGITTNLNDLSYSLKSTQRKFDQMAGNLNTLTDTLKAAEINKMVRNLNATVAEAQTAVQKFNQNSGTLGKLMNDDSLYNNLNNSARNMDALMIDLKANPKRYVHFSVFGKAAGSGDVKVQKASVVNAKGSGEVKIKEANQVDTSGKTPVK
jgi:phospholipid/cholesterol/gamma-HCH transport system substrate-binding protein